MRATVGDRYVSCQPAPTFHGRVPEWVGELRAAREQGETSVLVAETAGRAERVTEILRDYGVVAVDISRAEVTSGSALLVTTGQLTQGFRLPAAKMRLFAETDIFDEERVGHQRRASAAKAFLSDFRDLKVGDHVVHVDNGIGVFVGLKQINVGHETREFMELRYAGDDKLFVPVDRLDLVQKLSGSGRPTLDRLGGATWEKAKSRVKKAMRDMADELLKLYAARKAVQGHVVPAGHALAGGVRGRLPVRADTRPGQCRHRHQARHGVADADGSPAVWRRRLRQDGSGDARRVQGGHGRQAGGRAGADDRARAAASEDAAHAICGVSGAYRHGQSIPHARPSRPSR